MKMARKIRKADSQKGLERCHSTSADSRNIGHDKRHNEAGMTEGELRGVVLEVNRSRTKRGGIPTESTTKRQSPSS
jgi:hypothetical protein